MAERKNDRPNSSHENWREVAEEQGGRIMPTLLTGVAIAFFAPELLAGMAVGVAAMLAPRLLPSLGWGLRPLMKSAVKAGYAGASKARVMAAEAGEQVPDIVAEAQAEQGTGKRAVKAPSRKRTKRRGAHA